VKRLLARTLTVIALGIAGLIVAFVVVILVAIVFGGGLGDACPPYC
jgi:hypothetical protein